MDRILLRGLECRARIGVTNAERQVGQRLRIDVDLFMDLSMAGRSDRITDTISYAAVAKTIVRVAREDEYKLLERLADEIARTLLATFPVETVRVQVKKVPPPVDLSIEVAGVEIERSAADI